jgi:hypothetical protein
MRPRSIWSAALVAGLTLALAAGCASSSDDTALAALSSARTTTTKAGGNGSTTTKPGGKAVTLTPAQKEIALDLANAMADSDSFGGLTTTETRCVAEHLVASLGTDDADTLVHDVTDDSVALPIDKAREAGAIVSTCADYRNAVTNSMIESGLTATAAKCFVAKLNADELALSSAMDFMDESDYDTSMKALDRRGMTLIGECVPRKDLADMVASTFEDQEIFQSLSHGETVCIANGILDTLGFEGMAAFGSGSVDKQTANTLAKMMVGCANFRLVFALSITRSAHVDDSVATCVAKGITDDDARALLALSMTRGDVRAYSYELGRKHSAEWIACGVRGGGTTRTF